jgi:hypothetical protein
MVSSIMNGSLCLLNSSTLAILREYTLTILVIHIVLLVIIGYLKIVYMTLDLIPDGNKVITILILLIVLK